ncbi:MAG: calcium/sodium antiporter [Roseitalea sp.]|jgi:cation:H+ antiporter|nr:calcium/sodium antiporter [Roseitalea sp.]MBO6745304.1 calcium/sodium antiporter [Roseitalea sp.]
MAATIQLLAVFIGLAIVIGAADKFVSAASSIADIIRVPHLFIGLSVVAFGTSLPELAVSLNAATDGRGAMAIGNVVGSNFANMLLILGICATIAPVPVGKRTVLRDGVACILATGLFFWATLGGIINAAHGGLFVVLMATYLLVALKSGETFQDDLEAPSCSLMRNSLVCFAAAFLIWVGSELTVYAAVTLSRTLGLSEALIGVTVLALGTSLPELATCLTCLKSGRVNMLVGAILGSNLFNIIAIIGITSLVVPIEVPTEFVGLHLPLLLAATVITVFLLATDFVLVRWEGLALLTMYCGYIYLTGSTELALANSQ